MTIEKVDLSKEELDQSLFEYEQFKASKTKPNKRENLMLPKFSVFELTNSKRLNSLVETDILENLERSLEAFKKDNYIDSEADGGIISVQEEYKKLALNNGLNLSKARIQDLASKFRKTVEDWLTDKSRSSNNEFGKNEFKATDLKDLYKWKPVTEPVVNVDDSIDENQDKDYFNDFSVESGAVEQNEKILNYAFYYEYYYKNLLKQFLAKTEY